MSSIIRSIASDIGPKSKQYNDDCGQVAAFRTAGGLELAVAVVADGVGGAEDGFLAARVAVDSSLDYLARSRETDIPALLTAAVRSANHAVYAKIRHSETQTYTTLALAVIVNENQLYVANVGDSRVYLLRGQKLTQLTLDHSFANLVAAEGSMSREAAEANPSAHVLMRYLGRREDIAPDLGFYVGSMDMRLADQRGRQGLKLRAYDQANKTPADAVLVCSDRLTKLSPGGHPFATDEEIVRVLSHQEGDSAARELISIAKGREVDDNVTVALLQLPDPQRTATLAIEQESIRRKARRRQLQLGVAASLIIALLSWALVSLRRNLTDAQIAATVEAVHVEETQAQAGVYAAQTQTWSMFELMWVRLTRSALPGDADTRAVRLQAGIG